MDTLQAVVAAAADLVIRPRTRRWAHLSLCVLDATFSIGARYASTVRTCGRYADHAGLVALVDPAGVDANIGTGAEQALSSFVGDASAASVESFAADVLHDRRRTSTRGGILKAAAALRCAEILVDEGVERYANVAGLFEDEARTACVAERLRSIPGNGASDVRLGYLWMLLGDDDVIKPDRMVMRWLEGVLGRPSSTAEARALLAGAAAALGCTPWTLDHAVWQAQRARRAVIASDTATTRTYRALQGRWREEVLGLPAGSPTGSGVRRVTVDSMLPAAHDGACADEAGWNLMSSAAVRYARERLPVVRAADGLVEADRLWRNMLSSQPLAFSIVGELRAHPVAALAVLSALSGHELVAFYRVGADGPWRLDGLQAEWAPPRHENVGDRSGFDIAAAVRTAAGQRMLLTVEVKYTDRFSRTPLEPERYTGALHNVGLDAAAATRLVADGASQFLRSVLLTDSVRRGGKSGTEPLDAALAVVLSRDDDRAAEAVVQRVAAAQSVVPVARWGLATFLTAAAAHAELEDWADAMHARYVPEALAAADS